MKKLVSIGLVACLTIVAGLFFGSNAHAQTTSNEQTQTARCTVAQGRLTTRITQVTATKDAHIKAYEALLAKIETIITSAETAGYDVTELTTAQENTSVAVQTYTTKVTDYLALLTTTKGLPCSESASTFATSLLTARKALTETRQSSLAVRTTFKAQVIPALQDYATWLKENAATEETN